MSKMILRLRNLGTECPGLLRELGKISAFPEQFQPYYLSNLLRTYRGEIDSRHPNVQEEWRRAIIIMTEAGVRPATIADDIAHQVASEIYLKNKWKI